MLNLVLLRSSRNLSIHSIVFRRCYHAGKAGTVHTAIQRGLRKSRGQGFRGSQKGFSADDPREKYRVEHGIPKYEPPPRDVFEDVKQKSRQERPRKSGTGRATRGRKDMRDFERQAPREISWLKRGRLNTAPRELRIRLGKRLIAGKEREDGGYTERLARSGQSYEERGSRHSGRYERDSGNDSRPWSARKDDERSARPGRSYEERGSKYAGRREQDSDDIPRQFRHTKEPFERKRDNQGRTSEGPGSDSPSARSFGRPSVDQSYGSESHDRRSESSSNNRYPSLSFKRGSSDSTFGSTSSAGRRPSDRFMSQREPDPFDRTVKYDGKFASANAARDERSASSGPKFTRVADSRIPLSIPYTTPASEFLYGTSVVEAALSSRREPRRKLYKLYIYTGENREDPDQDARLERLAKRSGVEVVRAGNEWLRIMDKMSAGRPHNGYILEASPLPKLPVTSLGQLTTVDGQDGFEVCIDYQSREEAAVNGTFNFVKIPRSRHGKRPLVLLLDSIVDPGNLGSIIRTAAFLGVTAIAISTRNSASFTPVVLKASAGASEDVTLLMVNKPAGFVVDSKNAGWKVFAAVAPAKKHDPAMPASISTDQLDDPLSKGPCILMLGSEGEGLRWNLRSKADVDLYIEGSRQSHNVDSLNVSVAAGILCNSFLKRSKPKEAAPIRQEQEEDKEVPEAAKLF